MSEEEENSGDYLSYQELQERFDRQDARIVKIQRMVQAAEERRIQEETKYKLVKEELLAEINRLSGLNKQTEEENNNLKAKVLGLEKERDWLRNGVRTAQQHYQQIRLDVVKRLNDAPAVLVGE